MDICSKIAKNYKFFKSKQFVEDSFELRSITTHMEHLEAIEDDPSQSREFGVNHESLLMEIEYFDICNGVLISDVMHDLFEGVLQYERKLMLIQFIEKRYFTLNNLNSNIDSLELTYGTESIQIHISINRQTSISSSCYIL